MQLLLFLKRMKGSGNYMIKVFISQPMKNKTQEEILTERNKEN